MGFFFRKSLKLGPLRVNLSKSGVGVSAGVKGARVSVGPRGTYLNAGLKGIGYRQKLNTKQPVALGNSTNPVPPPNPLAVPVATQHGVPRIYVTLGVILLMVLAAVGLLILALITRM